MKKLLICCFTTVFLLFCLVCCAQNKVDPTGTGMEWEEFATAVESKLADENGFSNPRVTHIMVDILDVPNSKDCRLHISGTHDGHDGKAQKFHSIFKITRDDFDALYSVNGGYVLYNVEKTDVLYYDTVITEIPSWAIEGMYNIVFNQ